MKRYFLPIIISSAISCSKSDNSPNPTSSITEGYDSEMISNFNDSNFEVIVKQTLLDTSFTKSIIGFSIHAARAEDDSLTFDWTFDNKSVKNPTYQKAWRSEKWLKGSSISVDASKLSGTVPVSVDIKINKDGTTKRRSARVALKQKFEKYDVFNFNYGSSRVEVLAVLRDVYKLSSLELNEASPTAINAIMKGFGNWDHGLQFKFDNNRLIAISEFGHNIESSKDTEPYVFNTLLKRFGSKEVFREVYNPTTKKNEPLPKMPYSWTHNGIKFTVDYKDFEVGLNKNAKFRALTYEKVN